MCCLSILIQVVLNGFCLGRGLNIATNSIVPRYKDIDKLMNVQLTTSPGVLNVMSNKRYGADLVQCDAILLSPPHPQSQNYRDVLHIRAPISLFVC